MNTQTTKPLVVELFCGTFGWSAGFLAEGYRAIGFDIEHLPHHGPIPDGAELVLQDVLTLHGSQFRDAAVIVASPPCQEYSKRAMPFKDGKAQTPKSLGVRTPAWWSKTELPKRFKRPEDALLAYASGAVMNPVEMREWMAWKKQYPLKPPDRRLFDACFRIQREASDAAGRYIPLVVENVRGAQPWIGRSSWRMGSFHLWGDVPALMPINLKRGQKVPGFRFDGSGGSFHSASVDHTKNIDGSWFNIGSPGQKETNRNPVHELIGQKKNLLNPNFCWCGHDELAHSAMRFKCFQCACENFTPETQPHEGQKIPAYSDPRRNGGKGVHLTSPAENEAGTKIGGDWFSDPNSTCRKHDSRSNARKAASAQIAKIPFELSSHIARVFKPRS